MKPIMACVALPAACVGTATGAAAAYNVARRQQCPATQSADAAATGLRRPPWPRLWLAFLAAVAIRVRGARSYFWSSSPLKKALATSCWGLGA